MKEVASRWRRDVIRSVLLLATAAGSRDAVAQFSFNPSSQLWPSGTESARPWVAVFGSAVQCSLVSCDPAPSFGIDAKLVGPLRAAVAGPRTASQYGLSYAWRHLDVATRIGGGASVARPFKPPKLLQRVRITGDSLSGLRAETSYVAAADTSGQDATRWSSAEARFTWREARWWVTALVGRLAVTREGAGMWGGLQLGADLGRGTSLLLGMSSSPRLLTGTPQSSARSAVSLGFGFNAGIFDRAREGRTARPPETAAFTVAPSMSGRIRITVRVRGADGVEFASDCTQWTPVAMTRTADGWAVEVAALPGLHRANIRVNGGRWIAPPGLAPVDDDFAGEVGIFVVQ